MFLCVLTSALLFKLELSLLLCHARLELHECVALSDEAATSLLQLQGEEGRVVCLLRPEDSVSPPIAEIRRVGHHSVWMVVVCRRVSGSRAEIRRVALTTVEGQGGTGGLFGPHPAQLDTRARRPVSLFLPLLLNPA